MLATSGEPFDSDEHLFEIKWDGTRALAFVEAGELRLVNRRRVDITERYPDLDFLRGLEDGTVLDGEIVVLGADGTPDFSLLMSRESAASELRWRSASRVHPATFVAFDQLYRRFDSIGAESLAMRRETLRATVGALRNIPAAGLVISEGVVGAGRRFFDEVAGRGLEGVLAKRLDSRYLAGKRSPAWVKIKQQHEIGCAIIGYLIAADGGLRSLIIAAPDDDGDLRCVGKVGSGLGERDREKLEHLLRERARKTPIIPCDEKGNWVEPGLFCTVSYLERTESGHLRAPVFRELLVDAK